jgi:hypothetical protein
MDPSFYVLSPRPREESPVRDPLVVSYGRSPDRPHLLPIVDNVAQTVKEASSLALKRAQQTAATLRELASNELHACSEPPSASPSCAPTAISTATPWSVSNEVFSILEPVLRERALQIATDESAFLKGAADAYHFTAASLKAAEAVYQAEEETRPLEHAEMVPMARAALAEDAQLVQLRYRLVPSILTESVFWNTYFL